MIEHKADVNQARDNGVSPLYITAYKGHLEIVKYLLENNANIEVVHSGKTPLTIAAEKKYHEIYAFLTLWKIYQGQKNHSLLSQVQTILSASVELSSVIPTLKSVSSWFKPSTKQFSTALFQCPDQNVDDLKLIIERNRKTISPLKYDFIMRYILNDKMPALENDARKENKV